VVATTNGTNFTKRLFDNTFEFQRGGAEVDDDCQAKATGGEIIVGLGFMDFVELFDGFEFEACPERVEGKPPAPVTKTLGGMGHRAFHDKGKRFMGHRFTGCTQIHAFRFWTQIFRINTDAPI